MDQITFSSCLCHSICLVSIPSSISSLFPSHHFHSHPLPLLNFQCILLFFGSICRVPWCHRAALLSPVPPPLLCHASLASNPSLLPFTSGVHLASCSLSNILLRSFYADGRKGRGRRGESKIPHRSQGVKERNELDGIQNKAQEMDFIFTHGHTHAPTLTHTHTHTHKHRSSQVTAEVVCLSI